MPALVTPSPSPSISPSADLPISPPLYLSISFLLATNFPRLQNDPPMTKTRVKFETNQGTIVFNLYPEFAPKACENFTTHVENGYYDGIVFHRVIPEFMVQCGDPTGTGRGGESIWGKNFDDECTSDLRFDKSGILAMANSGPGTNGSQFFVTTAKTPWLNMRHTIFGEVVEGYDIVQTIEGVATDGGDKPIEVQKIIKATVVE